MRIRRLIGLAVTVALLAAGCAGMRDEGTKAAPMQKSLYDRLGGKPAITAVVDDFVANVAADSRINRRFANTNIPRLKGLLVGQICEATGGPCTYRAAT
jgi:hemoglobin